MSYGIDTVDLIFEDMEEKSDKAINNFDGELKMIRAGRANAHILDKVQVNYYGMPTPLNQMSNITVPEARLLVIKPYDKNALTLPSWQIATVWNPSDVAPSHVSSPEWDPTTPTFAFLRSYLSRFARISSLPIIWSTSECADVTPLH